MKRAKFLQKAKQEIYERDGWCCVICWKPWTDYHHAKFGTEANYWLNRNKAKEGCIVCRDDHNNAHSCKRWEWVRQQCVDYVNKLK